MGGNAAKAQPRISGSRRPQRNGDVPAHGVAIGHASDIVGDGARHVGTGHDLILRRQQARIVHEGTRAVWMMRQALVGHAQHLIMVVQILPQEDLEGSLSSRSMASLSDQQEPMDIVRVATPCAAMLPGLLDQVHGHQVDHAPDGLVDPACRKSRTGRYDAALARRRPDDPGSCSKGDGRPERRPSSTSWLL